MSSKVDWEFARKTAAKVASREPFSESYLKDSIHRDLLELTPQAETLVAAETGLTVATEAKAKVIGRSAWVDANVSSFQRLLRPLLREMGSEPKERTPFAETSLGKRLGPIADKADPLLASAGETVRGLGPKIAGAEVGALLGWMSGRVLGQYDLLIAEDDNPQDQDWVYYVGPNIISLEKRYGFPPREFRLWIAVHECTHRAQFMGVPWLRPYFLSMVNDLLDSVKPESSQLSDMVKEALQAKRQKSTDGEVKSGGLAVALANPEQRKVINRLTGLMSLLEGHGDIIMDRAAKDLIPSQPRFSRVLSQRRKEASGIAKIVQRITGMDAKLAQYEEGEEFVKYVENVGGRTLFDQVWSSPEALPNLEEIRSPQRWIDRVSV